MKSQKKPSLSKVFREWGEIRKEYPRNQSVHALFEAAAREFPDNPCVVYPGQDGSSEVRLTYAQFDELTGKIAALLSSSGVRPGDRVGFLIERTAVQAAAVLAILKAGAAYVPIDASYPSERINYMLKESAIRYLLTSEKFLPIAEATGIGGIVLGADGRLQKRFGEPADVAPEPAPSNPAEATAYIMFTSGSTGKPKGVCIPHRGIVRLVKNSSFTPLGPDRVFLQLAPVSFDLHTLEFWAPLLNGGLCVLYPGSSVPDPALLSRIIPAQGVTSMWLTAALFNMIVQEAPGSLAGLSELLVGGEALSAPHIRMAQERLPGLQLVNGYGPTESTTFATCYRIPSPVPAEWTSIPIGTPIENTSVYVLDENMSPVPVGEPGELYIGGDGLSSGYFGRPELTAEKFVPDPFSPGNGGRLYKSGDKVRWLDSGIIDFLGRFDDQIKLNGNRIELGEVKTAILGHPDVQEALVNVQEVAGQRRLVAYFTVKDPGKAPPDIEAFLRKILPGPMVPSFFMPLERFPANQNGKIDQKALPPPLRLPAASSVPAPPKGVDAKELEGTIASIWKELLGIDEIPPTEQFFKLGGSSLLAIKMVARMKTVLGLSVPITDVFKYTTIRDMARHLSDGDVRKELAVAAPEPVRDSVPVPAPAPRSAAPSAAEDPVAVIGMAGRFPGARNVDEFWQMLIDGRDGIKRFERSELDPSLDAALVDDPDYVKARGVLEDVALFDAGYFGIGPHEAELMDPQQRVFLEVVVEALENAGCDPRRYPGAIGVFAGSGNTTYWLNNLVNRPDVMRRAGDIAVRIGNEKDYLTTRVAYLLGLRGPAMAIDTACSTSLVAIAEAFHSLRAGECDVALAGGVTITCPPNSGNLFQEGSMFSPDGMTRAFDAKGQGTTFSDGAVAVVLKRLSKALADGDRIYSVIKGVGLNNDGSDKMSFVAPSVTGQSEAIRMAHASSGVSAESISYVEAHGTATPIGDPIEVAALTSAFRKSTDKVGFCALGSVKSNIGHTISAAGGAGFIKASLALANRILPATAYFTSPNPQLHLDKSPFWVVGSTQPWTKGPKPLRAGVSSFGFGGTNAHVVIEEPPEQAPSADEEGPQLLLLSAKSVEALEGACANLAAFLSGHPETPLADAAFTLQAGRTGFEHRTYVSASSVGEAVEGLKSAASKARAAEAKSKTAFLFPGQGSQYAGMGTELYATSPAFRRAFQECSTYMREVVGEDILDVIKDRPELLSRTRYTQPALFAVQYSLARHWESLGIRPDGAIGHSVGEFVAACLSGVMEPKDAARLVALRGRLVDACPPGGMMAVRIGREELERILPPSLDIAVCNAPSSHVVSGPIPELEAFAKLLESKDVSCKSLNTSHAFHSRMMESAVAEFRAEVSKATLHPPRVPFVSTLTGGWIKAEEAMDPDYWGRHLRCAVRFSQAVDTLLDDEEWICLEVGPQATLAKLVLQNPKARGRTVIASLGCSAKEERSSLSEALGALWRAGAEPDWAMAHHGSRRRKIPLPTYPFQRKRYWIDPQPFGRAIARPLVGSDSEPVSQNKEAETEMAATRKPQLTQKLLDILEELSGQSISTADSARTFAELGLDSLQLTQIVLQASKTFGVKLKLRHLVEEYTSPTALVDFLDAEVSPGMFAPCASPAAAMPAEGEAGARAAPAPQAVQIASVAQASPVAAASPRFSPGQIPQSSIEAVLSQQMDVMRQQLALLSGMGASPVAAPPAPAQAAPAAAAVVPAAVPAETTGQAGKAADPGAPRAEAAPPVKAHGPQLVIDRTGRKDLTPTQEKCRKRILSRYAERTKASKEFTQRNRAAISDPRAVAGFKPQMKEMIYPIVVNRSSGCRLWDLDGNEYVDLLSGYGSNFFGFGAPFVKAAIAKQMEIGMEIGPSTHLIEEVSRLFHEFVPMDRIAFCNTGSEAVLATFRMARTATGKDLIVMFHGSYHGMFDEVVVRAGGKGKSVPAAPGIPGDSVGNVLLLDWANEDSLKTIRERANEIAAVITEPVQSRTPEIQPAEFLRNLRKATEETGIPLIFDEVVTGFRIAPGGAQEYFGIKADMATYGKVIGGGLPIGIVAGKKEFMDCLDGGYWQFGDDSVPEVGVTYFAGTFVRHPLALAAAVAALERLKSGGPGLYRDLNAKTAAFALELNSFFEAEGAPVRIRNFGSLIKIDASHDVPFHELLFILLRLKGVHCWDGRPDFLTLAHAKEDLDYVVKAFRESIAELQEGGFYPTPVRRDKADRPPVPGARLGRDQSGAPAWFVPDPENASRLIEVK